MGGWRAGLAALGIGVACAGGEVTDAGPALIVCRDDDETLCNRQCVDLHVHPGHCGACFNSCRISEGAATACEDGTCVCGDSDVACEGTPDDTCCVTGEGAGACVDLLADEANCGACGARCEAPASNVCRLGRCVCGVPTNAKVEPAACPDGQECCGDGTQAFCVSDGACPDGG